MHVHLEFGSALSSTMFGTDAPIDFVAVPLSRLYSAFTFRLYTYGHESDKGIITMHSPILSS